MIKVSDPVVVLVGAHFGEGIPKCQREYGNTIYAIEPVPGNYSKIEENYSNNQRIVLIKKAAWIEDEIRGMNIYDSSVSHSLVGKKKVPIKVIEVEAFDFSKFLSTFTKHQVRFMRMDIEGAEYAVLAKCFEDGTMDRVQELHIELHKSPKVQVPTKLVEKTLRFLKDWQETGHGKLVEVG